MKLQTETVVVLVGIAAVTVGAVYLAKKAQGVGSSLASAASTIGTALNPVSDQNIAYKGVNALGTAATGDNNFTLGGWVYDKLHTDPMATSAPPAANDLRQIDRILERAMRNDTPPDDYTGFGVWG